MFLSYHAATCCQTRHRMMRSFWSLIAIACASCAAVAPAAPILWVNDGNGVLGTVDVGSGEVDIVGNMGIGMTDIAFAPNGDLYGISATQLYSINSSTAAATPIGPTGISLGNALVFEMDGTLYGAGGGTSSLYQINPTTGAGTAIGNVGYASAGDLAFVGADLYMSSLSHELIRIDLDGGAAGTSVGPFGFTFVFGLATPGNGALYGISGTQVFSVDVASGAGTLIRNYAGQGLAGAYGSSFITEATPEPSAALLLAIGAGSLTCWRRRRRRGA